MRKRRLLTVGALVALVAACGGQASGPTGSPQQTYSDHPSTGGGGGIAAPDATRPPIGGNAARPPSAPAGGPPSAAPEQATGTSTSTPTGATATGTEEAIDAVTAGDVVRMCTSAVPSAVAETFVSPDVAAAAFDTDAIWRDRNTLRVRFISGGDQTVRSKIENLAHRLSDYANVKFVFGNDPNSEIRIAVTNSNRSWSYMGRFSIPENSGPSYSTHSMEYGWLTPSTSDSEYSRVVLHEFGHALGMHHEHSSPTASGIPWDREKVYAYYAQYGWTRADVDRNIFRLAEVTQTNFSDFDNQSIMLYSIPKELTLNGFSTPWNTTLSSTDQLYLSRVYPRSGLADGAVITASGDRQFTTGRMWYIDQGKKRAMTRKQAHYHGYFNPDCTPKYSAFTMMDQASIDKLQDGPPMGPPDENIVASCGPDNILAPAITTTGTDQYATGKMWVLEGGKKRVMTRKQARYHGYFDVRCAPVPANFTPTSAADIAAIPDGEPMGPPDEGIVSNCGPDPSP